MMFILLNLFYQEIVNYASNIKLFPHVTDSFIYDETFTIDWLIEHLKSQKEDDELWRDGGHCYEHLMNEMLDAGGNMGYLTLACHSDDVGEYFLDGGYAYYYGKINDDVPFLYHNPDDWILYPSRLTLYGPKLQIHLRSDSIYTEIYEINQRTRNLFFIKNGTERTNAITSFLKNSDRPLGDVQYKKKRMR